MPQREGLHQGVARQQASGDAQAPCRPAQQLHRQQGGAVRQETREGQVGKADAPGQQEGQGYGEEGPACMYHARQQQG